MTRQTNIKSVEYSTLPRSLNRSSVLITICLIILGINISKIKWICLLYENIICKTNQHFKNGNANFLVMIIKLLLLQETPSLILVAYF